MNMGFEEEELLPFKEPSIDLNDQKRIEILIGMGYSRKEVEESLQTAKFDDCYASYLLLGRKPSDVSALSLKMQCKILSIMLKNGKISDLNHEIYINFRLIAKAVDPAHHCLYET